VPERRVRLVLLASVLLSACGDVGEHRARGIAHVSTAPSARYVVSADVARALGATVLARDELGRPRFVRAIDVARSNAHTASAAA
jgi:hypothetical protein